MLLPPKRKKRAKFLCRRDFKAGVSGTRIFPACAKVWCGSRLPPEVPRIIHGVSGIPESPTPGHRSLRPISIKPVKTQVWCATGLLSGGSPEGARSFRNGRSLRPLDPGTSGLAWQLKVSGVGQSLRFAPESPAHLPRSLRPSQCPTARNGQRV